jgi:hypothetical protein
MWLQPLRCDPHAINWRQILQHNWNCASAYHTRDFKVNTCRLGGTFQHLSWAMAISTLGYGTQQTYREDLNTRIHYISIYFLTYLLHRPNNLLEKPKPKGPRIPVTGPVWPRGFQEVYAPRFPWHSAHEGGEVFSLTHRPPLPPGNVPGTHFH